MTDHRTSVSTSFSPPAIAPAEHTPPPAFRPAQLRFRCLPPRLRLAAITHT
jgi:hypothetical protein